MPETLKVTYDSVIRDLKSGKYMPIYLLMGDESFYIDKISDFIADKILSPEERDFNQAVIFGSDVNADDIVNLAKQYPVMAEHRVVIVKEAQNLRNWDALEKYVGGKMMPTSILVLCYKNGSIDKRKKLPGLISKNGVLLESNKIKDWQLPAFIENYLKKNQVGIDPKSVQMISDSIGSDLSRLVSELEKLMISLPENDKRVNPKMVEKQIGVSKDFNAFELRDSIVNKNIYKANQIMKYFDENPKAGSIFAFLPMIFKYFQNLMIAYYSPRKDPDSLASYLELRGKWATKDYITGMRNFSGVKVMQIISKIREIDAKSKGLDNPNTPVGELMQELLFFILH
jgi:DNA polymerase III subunit delta